MDPALWELLRSGEPDEAEETEAIVRLARPEVEVPGLRIVARFGDVATCSVRKDAIERAWEHPEIVSLKRPRALGEERAPDHLAPARRLPPAVVDGDERRPPGLALTGAGVLLGFVDWGCDFDHCNFKHADGSTRLEALWDQRGPRWSGAPRPYGYGVVHSRRQIDAALRSADPYDALDYRAADADRDCTGAHGTHVMDIAAGNGACGGPVGIAPEATLCFVHLADRGTSGLANLGDSVRLLEAVHFIARLAGDRPWVINLCLGRHGGPHDGCTLAELALDSMLAAAPERCIVESTGNYFDKSIHASGRLEPGELRTLTVVTDREDVTPNELEVWYAGEDELSVRLESPTGARTPWVALGERADVREGGRTVGRLYHRACDPNNRDNHVDLFLDPFAPAGAWRVSLHAIRVLDGTFHAWLERDEACTRCQAHFVAADASSASTTGTIANGHLPIVVGAYDARGSEHEPATFSSAGPTRDDRPKPDMLAAGSEVLAARSAPRGASRSAGALTRKSGTSMAAPHVAGAVALCLQGAPHALGVDEVRALVLGSARPAGPGGSLASRYGRGYLDIAGLTEAVSALRRAARRARPSARGFDMQPDLDPEQIQDRVVRRRNERRDEEFDVLGGPEEALRGPARHGDILVRVGVGETAGGRVAVVCDTALLPPQALTAAARDEQAGPAADAPVAEDGQPRPMRPQLEESAPLTHCEQARARADGRDAPQRRLLELLKRRIGAHEQAEIEQRVHELTALFDSLGAGEQGAMRKRLDDPNDPLGRFFECELDRILRARLRGLLDAPAASPAPAPAPHEAPPCACRRDMHFITLLCPWEKALLALANDTREDAFDGMTLIMGPLFPGPLDTPFHRIVVGAALKHGYAITIENYVWFPKPLDTRTVKGLGLLVHESVHLLDYALVGTEAFLKAYAMKAAVALFDHDAIPDERRANRVERATERLLHRFPRLAGVIATCDDAAILAELRRGRDEYRAALKELLAGEPPAAEVELGTSEGAGRELLDQPLTGEPESMILALLRIPFADPNDPDLAKRRARLAEQFARVELARASALRERLVRRTPSDALADAFAKLSTGARDQLLEILRAKIGEHLAAEQAGRLAHARATGGVRADPRYIDILATELIIDLNTSTVTLLWKEAGTQRWITVALDDFDSAPREAVVGVHDVQPDRASAEAVVAGLLAGRPAGITGGYALYRGEHGTIVPTAFSIKSAPRIVGHLNSTDLGIDRLKANAGPGVMIDLLRDQFERLMPVPGISVDEQGSIQVSLDPGAILAATKLGRRARGRRRTTGAPRRRRGGPQWWIRNYGRAGDLKASQRGYQTYILKDARGRVLYVGKSGGAGGKKPQTWVGRMRAHIKDRVERQWMTEVDEVEVFAELTEMEAFALEEVLKQHHARSIRNQQSVRGEFTRRFPEADLGSNARSAMRQPTYKFRVDIVP